MALDRWIALLFLIVSVAYGYAAYTYPLLPFERNMPFLPSTLPKALSVIAALISLFIVLAPRHSAGESDLGDLSAETVRGFKLGQTFGLVAAMVLYALLLRPAGFIGATIAFIVGSSMVLGERKLQVLIPIAVVAAGSVWYLVQETLGIFLRPWPAFIG